MWRHGVCEVSHADCVEAYRVLGRLHTEHRLSGAPGRGSLH